MATNAQSRDEGDRPEVDEDDLAQGEGEGQQAQAQGQNQNDEKDTQQADSDGDAEEIARLRAELAQAKKGLNKVTRERDEAKQALTKVGQATGTDDPEAVATELREAREAIAAMRQEMRRAQKYEAVREALSDEKYAPYANNARYIVPTLELDDETDVGTDGKYDQETLKDAAERAVRQYVKDNPRAARPTTGAGLGGEPARTGSAPNSGGRNPIEEATKLNDLYGGVLSRVGKL